MHPAPATEPKDCELQIRIYMRKRLGKGLGHTGFTTVDADGTKTHYDFGAVNSATGKSTGCSMAFRAAALAIPLATIAAYSSAGLVVGQALDLGILPTMAAMYAGSAYSSVIWPTFGVLAKRDRPTIAAEPDRVFKIPISQQQLQTIRDFTDRRQRTVYSLGLVNCVNYTKRVLKLCGIRMPARLAFNTPYYLAIALERTPVAGPVPAHARASNSALKF